LYGLIYLLSELRILIEISEEIRYGQSLSLFVGIGSFLFFLIALLKDQNLKWDREKGKRTMKKHSRMDQIVAVRFLLIHL
jgi:hypothetical protein